jgi:acyl-CoA thioesterase FadM
MSSPKPDAAYRHRLSVRFRDCDAMGHVNHAVYFTYLEQCRLTFWRELTGKGAPNTRVIVARAECDYRAPAFFGDELEVRLWVGDTGPVELRPRVRDRPRGVEPSRRHRQDRDGQLRLHRGQIDAAAVRDGGRTPV